MGDRWKTQPEQIQLTKQGSKTKHNPHEMRDCQNKIGSDKNTETQAKTRELDTRTGNNRHGNTRHSGETKASNSQTRTQEPHRTGPREEDTPRKDWRLDTKETKLKKN